MTLSFWRYSHLALAIFSSLFLILAALTGTILAFDAIQEKIPSYQAANFESITLAETLPILRKTYPEITALSIDHNQVVTLQGIDQEGNNVNGYIDPNTGEIIGKPQSKSSFIQWTTALHRSLFLKENGRFLVGFISFLLALLALSGLALLINRQKSLRSLFATIVKENFAQYYHIVLGRLSLIPILILAITGSYLTLEKFHFFLENKTSQQEITSEPISPKKENTSAFQTILLSDISKIEFPFSEDEEDYYIIQLKDKEIEVNQVTGAIIQEKPTAVSHQLATLSLDLHTGRTNVLWALVLGVCSINLLFFIYSGFNMTLQRRSSRIKNKFKAKDSQIILLVGSENGSTLRFANAVQQQFIALGQKAYISEMNHYTVYPKAEKLLLFTSTHGEGDAPTNAATFLEALQKTPQKQKIKTTVVGFGSQSYAAFCGFAQKVETALDDQKWTEKIVPLQTINDKSAADFVAWIHLWNNATPLPLATTPSLYATVTRDLKTFEIIERTAISANEDTFLLTFKTPWKIRFQSGDLLAIYPENNSKERLYSIGKNNKKLQLIVKLHPHGLGSCYLNQLTVGSKIDARIIANTAFHFPKKATKVTLVSNGTGIAPFLGMIQENTSKIETHLYCGFKTETKMVASYRKLAEKMMDKNQLQSFHLALSRESNREHVTHLVQQDAAFFTTLLSENGCIMICGSLAMQKDVEAAIEAFCSPKTGLTIADYKTKGQILTDCY